MRRFNCWKNVRYLFFSRARSIYAISIAVAESPMCTHSGCGAVLCVFFISAVRVLVAILSHFLLLTSLLSAANVCSNTPANNPSPAHTHTHTRVKR